MAFNVVTELDSIAEFQAWSGGRDWLETIIEEDKVEEADRYLEDIIGEEGITETELNDLLWFDDDFKYTIGLSDFAGDDY
ncbi:TPA: hypothetical protein ACG6RF_002056 [Streptococcus agalactiae]|nr:hypothetical protein [Streptococcus agalactiae]HEO2267433.1 hypothetical protein [Streptococcus agalactiae]HEO7770435.1 hypothetical protein [Streptococcus agalactiae]